MLTMVIDHIGAILIAPLSLTNFLNFYHWSLVYDICRLVGRLAFPIFAFLIVEGYQHTRNFNKYLFRLLLLGLISEIPFDIAFNQHWLDFSYQNIFFTLALGLLAIRAYDLWRHQIIGTLIPLGILLCAEFLQVDYGAYGILMIMAIYYFKDNRLTQCLVGAALGLFQLTAAFAFIFIYFYNGTKGQRNVRWMYLIYPIHLVLLVLMRSALFNVLF